MPEKNFWTRVLEMIGRVSPSISIGLNYRNFEAPKVDASRPDYDLTRALFYSSVYNGKGAEYILGSAFAKPIVNAATAFTLASPIRVSCLNKDIEDDVNNWLEKNHKLIQNAVRNAMRDGDSYLRYENGVLKILSPKEVRKKVNPLVDDGVWGYDVAIEIGKGSVIDTERYLFLYRRVAPFRKVLKFIGKSTKGEVIEIDGQRDEGEFEEYSETSDIITEEATGELASLPIIHFANEKEPEMIYGVSEYQNCFALFEMYHKVLENAIKNNIYNSTAVPYIFGIKDWQRFLSSNFEKDAKGKYRITWDPNKILLGGEGVTAGFMEAPSTVDAADKLLNLLFWLICQTSETPEFVMGTAIQSSRASVSEQMPVMIRKAERKQEEFRPAIQELIDRYLEEQGKKGVEYTIIMPAIIDEKDQALNVEIVKLLLEYGCITKETANIMLGIDEYVDDVEEEVRKANEDESIRMKEADIYGFKTEQSQNETPDLEEKLDKTQEEIEEMIGAIKYDVEKIKKAKDKDKEEIMRLKEKLVKEMNELKEEKSATKKQKKELEKLYSSLEKFIDLVV